MKISSIIHENFISDENSLNYLWKFVTQTPLVLVPNAVCMSLTPMWKSRAVFVVVSYAVCKTKSLAPVVKLSGTVKVYVTICESH